MKAYVITTGALFAILTVLHVWRMLAERHLAQDPWYLLVTALAACLGLWAWRVLRAERT